MCVCVCVCECVCVCVDNVVFTALRRNVRVGRPKKKKKKKVIHLSEAVSLPNELYSYEGKHSDSNTCFIIVHNIFTPENDTPFSCS